MTLSTVIPASASLLSHLANPAARSLALSIIVGLGLAAFRVKTTSLRLFIWTALLYAALAMPALQSMLPPLPIPAPAFLQHTFLQHPAGTPASSQLAGDLTVKPEASIIYSKEEGRGPSSAGEGHSDGSRPPCGPDSRAFVVSSRDFSRVRNLPRRCFHSSRSLLRGLARPPSHAKIARIDEPRLTVRLAARANAADLPFTPRVAESEFISVPLTIGVLRSTVLLPSLARMGRWQARRSPHPRDFARGAPRLPHPASFASASRDLLVQPARLVARPASRRSGGAGQR